MTAPLDLSVVYADDEDVYIRSGGDYDVLAPDSQALARGTDGAFSAGTPWVLTSASVDFEAAGVTSGNVVRLSGANQAKLDWLAVDSAAGRSLTLRRPGMGAGVGQPYPPAAGQTGIHFAIKTLYPQIEEATFAINRLYAIDPNIAYRNPGVLYDLDESGRPRDLRQLCVLMVLQRRLAFEVRGDAGDFKVKLGQVSSDLDALRDVVQVRWGTRGTDQVPQGIFSARVSR